MMLRSYAKVAARNFVKHRLYSLINVLGLAAGLACCLLIALYILDETSYDRQHPDAERIHRVSQSFIGLDEPLSLNTSSPQVGPLLRDAFVEVEDFTRVYLSGWVFSSREGEFHDERVALADASVFDFFALEWVEGNQTTALVEPNSIVLTRSVARKYFGEENPYGQTLLMGNENQMSLQVTGLIEDLPANMHFATGAFLSLSSLPALRGQDILQSWDFANFATYLKLRPGIEYASLADAAETFLRNSMPESMREDWAFNVIKLPDIHLYAPLEGLGTRSSGNLANVLILSAIAAGLLLLAGINFINLSSARALQRSKEIIVRKAMGSNRRQLFQQFMGESLLIVLVATVLALVLVEVTVPSLNAFAGKQLTLNTLVASAPAALALLGAILLVAFLAGCYPALYLSALRPADPVVKGNGRWGRVPLRSLLVIFQFSISIILLIATLIVHSQVQLGKTVALGFNKDQVVVMRRPDSADFGITWAAFKAELTRLPQIVAATTSSVRPFELFVSQFDVRYEDGEKPLLLTQIQVDYDFFETYEVPLLAGRVFSAEYGGERLIEPSEASPMGSGAFVLNRAAAELLGWTPEAALGKWMERDFSEDFSRVTRGQVIGVVENMRFESLRETIKPTFYFLAPTNASLDQISLRLSGEELPQTLSQIDETWANFYPSHPINRSFLDLAFQAMYEKEERFTQLLSAFAAISILISCLGLFGLTAYTVESRTKEIGIRKVMGSSVWRIVLLLTNDFSKLVLLSNLIAWPVAYMAINRWLESFAYRIDLTPLVFIGSSAIPLCIAWVTVGGIAAKAASAKPVLALRYE